MAKLNPHNRKKVVFSQVYKKFGFVVNIIRENPIMGMMILVCSKNIKVCFCLLEYKESI